MLIVEWYRVDTSKRVVTTLGTASLFVVLGSVFVGASFVAARDDARLSVALAVLGWVATLAGPVRAIFGLRALLAEDRYIALTTTGLVVHHESPPSTIAWNAVDTVTHDPARDAIVVELSDAAPLALTLDYSGVSRRELANRIAAVRRRALFGLYESSLCVQDAQRRSA